MELKEEELRVEGDEVEDEVRAREGDGVEEGKEEWEMKLEFLLKFGLNCQNCWRCLSSDLRCGWFSVSSSEMNWFTCNIAHMRAESSPRTLAGAEANKKGHFTKRIANEAVWLAERERERELLLYPWSVPCLSQLCLLLWLCCASAGCDNKSLSRCWNDDDCECDRQQQAGNQAEALHVGSEGCHDSCLLACAWQWS